MIQNVTNISGQDILDHKTIKRCLQSWVKLQQYYTTHTNLAKYLV